MEYNISQQDLQKAFSTFSKDRPHLLRPIDFLVKYRELHGFTILNHLDTLIASCLAAGPQNLQSHLNTPLVDDGAEIIKKLKELPSMREFAKQELSFLLTLLNENNKNTDDTENNSNNSILVDFNSKCVPRLLKSRGIIKWARTADSRHLRIRIHTLQLARTVASNGVVSPSIFPDSFRLRLTVMWRTVLGKEESECFLTGPDFFQAPDMSTTAAIASGHATYPSSIYDRKHTGTPPESPQTPLTQLASTSSSHANFTTVSPHNETSYPTSPQVLTHSTNNLFFTVNSISSMSFDQSGPCSLPSVNISTTFRTTCDVSCTIRVAVEMPNGMEFAHGVFRTSFLPGDAAPCASFSVPLQRPSKLVQSSNIFLKKNSAGGSGVSNNSFPSSVPNKDSSSDDNNSSEMTRVASKESETTASKKDKEVMKKNKEALRKAEKEQQQGNLNGSSSTFRFANLLGGSSENSFIANRHNKSDNKNSSNTNSRRDSPASSSNSNSNSSSLESSSVNVGTLSVDVDSIASSFVNMIATMKQQEMDEERARRRRIEMEKLEKEESGQYEDHDDDEGENDDDHDEKENTNPPVEEEKEYEPEAVVNPEELCVAYFLKD